MKISKSTFKYLLDAVMLLLLVLMYDKNAISMSFHEIGGLFLLGLFVIHLLFNGKWISAVTKRLFGKQTPGKVRLGYCVDALLLVAFAFIGVSGVFISKELFSLHGGNAWKTVHYFASAAAILLMGVHLGLHWNMLRMKLLGAFAKRGAHIAGIVALCLVMLFGVYSMATTSFVRWLTMPFSAANTQFPGGNSEGAGQGSGEGAGKGRGQNRVELQDGEESEDTTAEASAPAQGRKNGGGAPVNVSDDKGNTISVLGDGESSETDSQPDGSTNSESNVPPDGSAKSGAPAMDGGGNGSGAPVIEGSENAEGASAPNGGGNGQSMPARDGAGNGGAAAPGGGEFRGEGHGGQASVSSTLLLIANYISITVVFAAITRGIEVLISKRRKTA